MIVSKKITAKGRVQGVWFRASARKKAEELNLAGFVSNLNDGNVYIEVEGEEIAVAEFIGWCWEGPQFANVKEVDVEEQEVIRFVGFEIRR